MRLPSSTLSDGVQPKFRDVQVTDPVAYVLSLNLHRRHLTPSQLSMVGAKARAIYDQQAKERQQAGQDRGRKAQKGMVESLPPTDGGQTRDKIGKLVGVSGKNPSPLLLPRQLWR